MKEFLLMYCHIYDQCSLNIFICRPKAKISTGFVAGTSVVSPVHVCTTHGLHQWRRKSPNTADQYNQWHQKVCQGNQKVGQGNQKEDQVNQKVGQGYQKGVNFIRKGVNVIRK